MAHTVWQPEINKNHKIRCIALYSVRNTLARFLAACQICDICGVYYIPPRLPLSDDVLGKDGSAWPAGNASGESQDGRGLTEEEG